MFYLRLQDYDLIDLTREEVRASGDAFYQDTRCYLSKWSDDDVLAWVNLFLW